MLKSYSALGGMFEYLNDDCDYLAWSQYLLNKLNAAGAHGYGIDVGCGNGYFTRALNKAGFEVDGIDLSPDMLSVAKQKAAKEGVRCEFLLGDITKLKLCRKANFCISVNDCINYVSKQKLKTAFTRVYSSLNKGGVFLFDISSEYKLRNIIANNLFAEERDDVSYIWFNEQTQAGVNMYLTFFIKRGDGLYERFEETHVQYAHTEEEVLCALEEAGFTNCSAEPHPIDKIDYRLQFTAYKG